MRKMFFLAACVLFIFTGFIFAGEPKKVPVKKSVAAAKKAAKPILPAKSKPVPAVAPATVPKPPPTPVTSTVTLSGPINLVTGPEPKAFQALEQRVGRIEEGQKLTNQRLGALEQGQRSTSQKLDQLLGKVDQVLAPQKTAAAEVEAEKALARKEGCIRHVCPDGRELCFYRPEPGKVSVYDWKLESWCPIFVFQDGDWYQIRGNCYVQCLPACETKAVATKLAWLKK